MSKSDVWEANNGTENDGIMVKKMKKAWKKAIFALPLMPEWGHPPPKGFGVAAQRFSASRIFSLHLFSSCSPKRVLGLERGEVEKILPYDFIAYSCSPWSIGVILDAGWIRLGSCYDFFFYKAWNFDEFFFHVFRRLQFYLCIFVIGELKILCRACQKATFERQTTEPKMTGSWWKRWKKHEKERFLLFHWCLSDVIHPRRGLGSPPNVFRHRESFPFIYSQAAPRNGFWVWREGKSKKFYPMILLHIRVLHGRLGLF